jgi:hypothetical protein
MTKRKSSMKYRIRTVAVEAITQRGPMTGRAILEYAIDNHKGVGWVPHYLAISGILASDPEGRFAADTSKRREWKLRQ